MGTFTAYLHQCMYTLPLNTGHVDYPCEGRPSFWTLVLKAVLIGIVWTDEREDDLLT